MSKPLSESTTGTDTLSEKPILSGSIHGWQSSRKKKKTIYDRVPLPDLSGYFHH